MKGYKVLVKRGLYWHVFYVWAAGPDEAETVAKIHIRAGVTVD